MNIKFRWGRIIILIIAAYLLYVFLTALLPFSFYRPRETTTQAPEWIETDERVVLIDGTNDAWEVRLDLLENAEETLDIAYYAFQGGHSVDLFLAYVYEAAERGVEVRIILDGIAHGMRSQPEYLRALQDHPNIQLAFYQKPNLMKPWAWHDRMHEKIIIADGNFSLTGGRNIGDKYFTNNDVKQLSIDRDVMLMKTNDTPGVIEQIQDYFNALWGHEDNTIITDQELKFYQVDKATSGSEKLKDIYIEYSPMAPNEVSLSQWQAQSYPINQAYFVTNSLGTIRKEPIVWENMLELADSAEDYVLIQSPYIIPTSQMSEDVINADLFDAEVTVLTNSLAVSNNVLGYSGYLNHRNSIIESETNLYEYKDDNSQIHAKSLIFDNKVSAIGSFNFDSRSVHLNAESMLVIDSPEFAKHFAEIIEERYIEKSQLIIEDNKYDADAPLWRHVIFNLTRPLSKLLEAML